MKTESQQDFLERIRARINKTKNFSLEEMKYAQDVQKYGVEYQGIVKDSKGNVFGKEYKITDPTSKADNANITVRTGEDLLKRIRDKKIQFGDE